MPSENNDSQVTVRSYSGESDGYPTDFQSEQVEDDDFQPEQESEAELEPEPGPVSKKQKKQKTCHDMIENGQEMLGLQKFASIDEIKSKAESLHLLVDCSGNEYACEILERLDTELPEYKAGVTATIPDVMATLRRQLNTAENANIGEILQAATRYMPKDVSLYASTLSWCGRLRLVHLQLTNTAPSGW